MLVYTDCYTQLYTISVQNESLYTIVCNNIK